MGSLVGAVGHNTEAVALREQLQKSQETSRRLLSENETLREELKRRSDLLVKKDGAHVAQVRRLEAAEKKIRELVRSEGEADYKSRTLAAKVASVEKSLAEAVRVRKALEKKLQNREQQVTELTSQSQSQSDRLEQLRTVSEKRSQSADTLEQQNRDLESKLARAIGKVELYQGKIESLQRQVSDKETEYELAHQKLDAAQGERDLLRRELDESRKQGRSYRDNLTGMEQMLASNRRQLAEVEDSLERSKVSLHRAETARKAALSEVDDFKQELGAKEYELSASQARVDQLMDQLGENERERGQDSLRLEAELDSTRSKLEELKGQIEALEGTSSQDKATSRALRKEREALAIELETRTRQLEELSRWAEKIKPAYENLKDRHVSLLGDQKETQAKLEGIRHQHDEAKAETTRLEEQQRDLVRQMGSLNEDREELLAVKARLESEIERLGVEREGQSRSASEMAEKSSLLHEDLLKERDQVAQLELKLDKAEHAIVSMENEKRLLHEQLRKISEDRLAAKQRSGDLEGRLGQAEDHVEQLSRDLHARNEELATAAEEIAAHQALALKSQTNVKELLRQRTQLLDNKKHLESQLLAAEEAEVVSHSKIEELEGERERLSQAIEALNVELDESTGALRVNIESLEVRLVDETEAREKMELEVEKLRELSLKKDAEYGQAVQELEEALENAVEERRGLKRDIEDLKSELDRAYGRTQDLEVELNAERVSSATLREELEGTRNEGERLLERSLQLEAQVETLESELRARHEESNYQMEERVRLEEERDRLTGSLADMGKSKKHLEAQLDRSKREALGLREYIDKLSSVTKERLEQAKAALEKRERQLHKYRDALGAKTNQLKALGKKFERSQMAENAYRGALMDLRNMLVEKEEIIEEAEWHLGLVYTTLEEGQADLESTQGQLKDTQLDLKQSRREGEELEGQLSLLDSEKRKVELELAEVNELHLATQLKLEQEQAQVAHIQDNLSRAETRLENLYSDLEDEQQRSANIGAQLTDALEERNRTASRLKDLHQEFQDWRDTHFKEEAEATQALPLVSDDRIQALAEELSLMEQQLVESQTRESELVQQIETLEAAAPQEDGIDTDRLERLLIEADERLEAADLEVDVLQTRLDESQARERALQESLGGLTSAAEDEAALKEELAEAKARLETAEQEVAELQQQLGDSRAQESSLSQTLDELRQNLEAEVAARAAAEEQAASEGGDTTPDYQDVLAVDLEANMLRGFDMGAELISAQLDNFDCQARKDELVAEMESVATKDALTTLLERMGQIDSELNETTERFDTLENEWNDYLEELDETSQVLLQKFTGLIEYEMREARQSIGLTEALQKELASVQAELSEREEDTQRLLRDKDEVTEQLEEELAQLSSEVTELNEQLIKRESDQRFAENLHDSEFLEDIPPPPIHLNVSAQTDNLSEDMGLEDPPLPPDFIVDVGEIPEPDAPLVIDVDTLGSVTEVPELPSPDLETVPDLPDLPDIVIASPSTVAEEPEPKGALYEGLLSLSERYIKGRQRIADTVGLVEERDRRLAELEREAELNRAPRPKPSLAEKLLRKTGFAAPEEEEVDDEAARLGRARERLSQKKDIFEFIDQQISNSQDLVAHRMFELQQSGYAVDSEQELNLKEQLQELDQEMESRSSTLDRLCDELAEEDPHKTAEDMPAVPNSFDLGLNVESDQGDSPIAAQDY